MRRALALLFFLTAAVHTAVAEDLQIYFIDVEGGQATLIVTPQRETLLVDAREVAFRLLLRPFEHATPYREYRLWRNDPRVRFEGVIHEKVVPFVEYAVVLPLDTVFDSPAVPGSGVPVVMSIAELV